MPPGWAAQDHLLQEQNIRKYIFENHWFFLKFSKIFPSKNFPLYGILLEGNEIFNLDIDSDTLSNHIVVGSSHAVVTIVDNDGSYIKTLGRESRGQVK